MSDYPQKESEEVLLSTSERRLTVLHLDPDLLDRFPEGYRHLAYLQSKNGFSVKDNLPGLRGTPVQKLYTEGKAWLDGSDLRGELLYLPIQNDKKAPF